MGIGDWGLGIGDWAQSPIPNPHPQNLNCYMNNKINKIKKLIILYFNKNLKRPLLHYDSFNTE